ncbi:hypothetical protein H1Q63_36435, partial [Desmonostoc muscorum CCALA 125]|nr:hypothetical protein [Desmonostoc muscorum CCALA 125]
GYNTYEETSAIDDYATDITSSVLDEVDDPLDMVLDDRTARTYNLDSPTLGEPSYGNRRAERSILDEDDDLIADEVADEEDYEEDDDDDDDDFDDE